MALNFENASWGQFEYLSEPQTEIISEALPVEANAPNFTTMQDLSKFLGQLEPLKVVLKNGVWRIATKQDEVEIQSFLKGDRFEETPCGIYELRAGERKNKITNATVRISSIREIFSDDETKETLLVCAVTCQEAWGDEEKLIEIPSKNYKMLFKKIREQFRDIQLSAQNIDALDEYLAKVNQRDAKGDATDLPREVRSLYVGWLTTNDWSKYYLGDDDFYKGYVLPQVADERRSEIFNSGFGFREVGHCNRVIETLFLFAHCAYTNYFFEAAGCPMRTLLFLKGRTNSLKTSTVSAIANIFSTKLHDCGIRLSSTPASLRDYVMFLRDNVVLVDDFSNSPGADNVAMERNAEMLIRAVGDGKFSSAISWADSKKIKTCHVRSAVILTGEEMLDLAPSSLYRILTLEVEQGTFDGKILRLFEDKQILREYFALFIKFLTENSSRIISYSKENFSKYNAYYNSNLNVPRFVDFATIMTLQADIILNFARWCGASELFIADYRDRVLNSLLLILADHQAKSEQQDHVKRFLEALFQNLNTRKGTLIAENEKIFEKNPSLYIGFREDSTRTVWLLFNDVYHLVSDHFHKLNESWTVKGETIKEELLRRNISLGKLKSAGDKTNAYVLRAKKAKIGNSRPRMLVLKLDAVDQILNEN